jgi:hypothetical protein
MDPEGETMKKLTTLLGSMVLLAGVGAVSAGELDILNSAAYQPMSDQEMGQVRGQNAAAIFQAFVWAAAFGPDAHTYAASGGSAEAVQGKYSKATSYSVGFASSNGGNFAGIAFP